MNASQNMNHDSSAQGHLAESLCRRWAGRPSATSRRSGAAVLEAVLVLPLLLALTLGVGEYGYFFYVKHNLVNASRAGARASIPAGATNSTVNTAVNRALFAAGMTPSDSSLGNYTVAIKNSGGADVTVASVAIGTDIFVTVSANWDTVGVRLIPPVMGGISAGRTVKATSVMRKESN